MRREENEALIRLADAICGLVRDAREGHPWAGAALAELRQHGLVTEL